jgi:hypothetical protein
MRIPIKLVPVAILFPAIALAQQPSAQPNSHLRGGRHGIEIGANIVGQTSTAGVQIGGTTVSTDAGSGVGGTLVYSYWVTDQIAFQVSASAIDAQATVDISGGTITNQSADVAPLLFGVKVQPFSLHSTDALRPFVSIGAGAFIGNSDKVVVGTTTIVQSRSETVLGGRVAAGVDLLLGRRFTLDVGAGYRLASDFSQPIGGDVNYSGAEFSVLFGILLGRGR